MSLLRSFSPTYQEQTFTLQSGESVQWHVYGDMFGCLDATGPFKVKFDDQPATQFRKGLSFSVEDVNPETGEVLKFQTVHITNPGAQSITVEVFAGSGSLRDARLTLPRDLEAFTGAARSISTSYAEIGSGDRVQIAQANADRLELIVSNMGAKPVFLGDAQVAWRKGLPIAPGGTATVTVQSEIYAYAQGAGVQSLAILEASK